MPSPARVHLSSESRSARPRASRFAAVCALSLCGSAGAGVLGKPAQTRQGGWIEDLRFVREELPRQHGDPWRSVSRERFEAELDALTARVPELADHQVAFELARVVALLGDGHTELQLFGGPRGFEYLPVVLYRFGDELRVVAATPEHRELIGSEVTHLGRLTALEALARVEPYLARDNPIEFLHQAPNTLASPQVLHALGACDDPHVSELSFVIAGEIAGEARRVALAGSTDRVAMVPLRQALGSPAARTATRPGTLYWFDFDEELGIAYFQLLNSLDQPGRAPLAQVMGEFLQAIDETRPRAVVIDVRLNNGGNDHLNTPLVEGIAARARLQEEGALYVLVGRRTFSAGVSLVRSLERVAHPILVGEPSRGNPRVQVNREDLVLPSSGLTLSYSQLHETREYPHAELQIELEAPPDFAALCAGVDPAWDAVVDHLKRVPSTAGR